MEGKLVLVNFRRGPDDRLLGICIILHNLIRHTRPAEMISIHRPGRGRIIASRRVTDCFKPRNYSQYRIGLAVGIRMRSALHAGLNKKQAYVVNPLNYNISVHKVRIDGEDRLEATVDELPDVHDYGDTYPEVFDLGIDTIATGRRCSPREIEFFPSRPRR